MKKIMFLACFLILSVAVFAQETTSLPQQTEPTAASVTKNEVVIIKTVGKELSFNKLVVYYNKNKKVQVSIVKNAQAQLEPNDYKVELIDAKGLRVVFNLQANSSVKIDFKKTEIVLSGDNFNYYLTDDIR